APELALLRTLVALFGGGLLARSLLVGLCRFWCCLAHLSLGFKLAGAESHILNNLTTNFSSQLPWPIFRKFQCRWNTIGGKWRDNPGKRTKSEHRNQIGSHPKPGS